MANNLASQATAVVVHDIETDKWFEASALPFDVERIHRVIEMNVRAIYFHNYGCRFNGSLKVFNSFFLSLKDPSINDQRENLFILAEQFFAGVPPLGDNPSVFTYRFARHEGIELLEFCYYGRNKALAVLSHA